MFSQQAIYLAFVLPDVSSISMTQLWLRKILAQNSRTATVMWQLQFMSFKKSNKLWIILLLLRVAAPSTYVSAVSSHLSEGHSGSGCEGYKSQGHTTHTLTKLFGHLPVSSFSLFGTASTCKVILTMNCLIWLSHFQFSLTLMMVKRQIIASSEVK